MSISLEERLMYKVMEAIYSSGIPISFKGSMVLKACLMEAGYYGETRHTVDIDANWNTDTYPTTQQMVDSLQKAIDKSGITLKINSFRQYGDGRSAGFEVRDISNDEILFTMDIDVNRPLPFTKLYEVEGLRFCGVAPIQMIADKVCVLSSDKIFRRIKDLVDLYYISEVFSFSKDEVLSALNISCRYLDNFNGFLNRSEELKHSYDKFRFEGCVNKPEFEDVYSSVRRFIWDILP